MIMIEVGDYDYYYYNMAKCASESCCKAGLQLLAGLSTMAMAMDNNIKEVFSSSTIYLPQFLFFFCYY